MNKRVRKSTHKSTKKKGSKSKVEKKASKTARKRSATLSPSLSRYSPALSGGKLCRSLLPSRSEMERQERRNRILFQREIHRIETELIEQGLLSNYTRSDHDIEDDGEDFLV